MKIYATASIPKYLLYTFSLIKLEEICQENLVTLKAIRYAENQIVCKLYGFKEDIKVFTSEISSILKLSSSEIQINLKNRSKIASNNHSLQQWINKVQHILNN